MARLINKTHLFIHIAKTGGTYFREALTANGIQSVEVGKKHSSWAEATKDNPYLQSTVPIMFVRHPVSWYLSRWKFAIATHFGEKIKFVPEAKAHWMAEVWSYDYPRFVEKIIWKYANDPEGGPCTQYFKGMVAPHIVPWKYEDLAQITENFIVSMQMETKGYSNVEDVRLNIAAIGHPLDSSKVASRPVVSGLIKDLKQLDKNFIKTYYEQV